MKNESNAKRSRRKFLSWSLLGGAGLLAQPVAAMASGNEDEETVPMLTPDGQLVHVRKGVLDQTQDRKKAGNKDILHWTEAQKTSKT